jgi:hypothetical protein
MVEILKFGKYSGIKKETGNAGVPRYSVLSRKIPKGITPCDYCSTEKKIEIELKTDEGFKKYWVPIEHFFGVVITQAKKIVIVHNDGREEELIIVNIAIEKIKRTLYLKLILEPNPDLPF